MVLPIQFRRHLHYRTKIYLSPKEILRIFLCHFVRVSLLLMHLLPEDLPFHQFPRRPKDPSLN